MTENKTSNSNNLWELFILFLRLGTTAFGGPAAHIAMMEDEVVRRRKWLTRENFLDMLGATNLIPGPNSTEMAIHVGYDRGGWAGLLIAGVSFIVPATVIVMVIAWAYARFGQLPQAAGILYGVKPVVLAIILQALWGLGRTAVKSPFLGGVALLATLLNFGGLNELLVLLGGGTLAAFRRTLAPDWREHLRALGVLVLLAALFLGLISLAPYLRSAARESFSLPALFLYFVKVGSVLYGSGYVLLAFLQADLVGNWQWLTSGQLLDATAVGQLTPGPVFTTATFIGYLLDGSRGALVATAGIFLPAFFFVAVSGPLIPRLRRSVVAGAFLDGLNVASLALMAVVAWFLGRAAVIDVTTVLLAVGSAVLLLRFRLNSAWLVLGGAIVGYAAKGIG
ncbi:MAG: chromate efflux transporter [Deltaproteobacteria bacterium]|nr:MAG: chromate efflux transporter [Deltaproteobacteria bacterium]